MIRTGAAIGSAGSNFGFHEIGFSVYSTSGTAKVIKEAGVPVSMLFKLADGRRPNVLDMIKNGEIDLIVNTPSDVVARKDEVTIRSTAVAHKIPVQTTLRAARASIEAIRAVRDHGIEVNTPQEYHS